MDFPNGTRDGFNFSLCNSCWRKVKAISGLTPGHLAAMCGTCGGDGLMTLREFFACAHRGT